MESQIHSELLQKIKKHSLIYIKWGVVPVGKEKKKKNYEREETCKLIFQTELNILKQ